eukprot:scaffold32620_cov55-Attheya_sp.AAC.3
MKVSIFLVLVASTANAFVVQTYGTNQRVSRHILFAETLSFSKSDIAGKELQLEEREDKDSELTELWLAEDGSVKMGQTDGPPVEKFWGKWTLNDSSEEKAFRMEVIRTYAAGTNTGRNQMGEFSYDVRREFWGDVSNVGGVLAVTGAIHGNDESKGVDCEVGYFSLIDEAAENIKIS